jgi:hypothetical protein
MLTDIGAREYETVQSNSDPLLGGGQAVLEWVTFSAISFTQLFTKPVCGPSRLPFIPLI